MHEVVGLSVILENYRDLSAKKPVMISKGRSIMIKSPPSPSSPGFATRKSSMCSSAATAEGFLDHCFLCKHKLLPAKDIYMYKGDRAFCSVECRCRQMFMDEEEANTTTAKTGCTTREYNCSLAAMKPPATAATATTTTTTTSSRSDKGPRNSFSTLATFCI
ncbi:FCS-Like Zinc finger 15 [Sesamum alatum]|uniref:FCS-Like Zinc finger 15 n=1 Tax=Sesamum alatum TaxID=300844 RepID=A0AAE2CTT7_9LAMI|nr:FCS-Like Zinc finger 15 [Sesamum alatum]